MVGIGHRLFTLVVVVHSGNPNPLPLFAPMQVQDYAVRSESDHQEAEKEVRASERLPSGWQGRGGGYYEYY